MRCRESSNRKLTTTNWQQLLKLIILQLHEKLPDNWTLTILWSLGLWNKLESWKGSISGFLMSWSKIKLKKKSFWSVIFSYCTQQQTFSWSNCDIWQKVDFIRQPEMTSSVAGLWRSSKALPKAKHAPERGHGHCLGFAACLIHYSFLNPSKTIISEKYAQPIDEMHWKLRCL